RFRSRARGLDGGREYAVELVSGNDEFLAERFVALDERRLAGQRARDRFAQFPDAVLRLDRGNGVVESTRLFVERHPAPRQHLGARREGPKLPGKILAPQPCEV